MMNNEIVEIVYKTFNLKNLLKEMINWEIYRDDMEQYIYEQLLMMKNDKLNSIYSTGKLRHYISVMIKKHRNFKPGKNQSYLSEIRLIPVIEDFYETEEIIDETEEDKKYEKIEWVENYIVEKSNDGFRRTGLTSAEIRSSFAMNIYKFYLEHDLNMCEVGKSFTNKHGKSMSKNQVRMLIKEAKNEIKNKYV